MTGVAVRLASSLPMAALATSIAAVATWRLSRSFRKTDYVLWHAVWSAIALASLAAPLLALLSPLWHIGVRIAPALANSPMAGRWLDRLAASDNWTTGVAVAGAAVFGARLVLGCVAARSLRTSGRALCSLERERLNALVPGAAAHCRVTARIFAPVVVGWLRGTILLPEAFSRWPDDRLEAILRHERQHLRRRDFLWNVVAAAQQALYWWNPFAWLVSNRIRLTAELASDRAAAGASATTYARHLVDTAQDLTHLSRSARVLAPGAAGHLEHRVEALLSTHDAATPSGRLAVVVTSFAAALMVLSPMLVKANVAPEARPVNHAALHAARHHH